MSTSPPISTLSRPSSPAAGPSEHVGARGRAGVLPVAVFSNPQSERNKRGMGEIEACLAGRSDVRHVRFEPGMDLAAVLRELARRETGLIVVNSGDGLVHGLLGAIFASGAFAVPPPLAILPRGMTNMTAADVGVGGADAATLARLLDLARQGRIERHLVRRRVLKVAYDPARPAQRGMFFGAAGIYDAIHLTIRHVHPRGFKGRWANVASLAAVLGRAALLGVDGMGLGGDAIGIGVDGGTIDTRRRALVLATTLERLVLGSRPFWNTSAAPIHFSAFDHPATGLVRHARTILYGGDRRRLPEPPYRSTDASRLELHLERPFTIDGEFFQSAPGTPVVVTAEEEARFVRLRS
jgi:hypothetical protein